MRRYVGADWDSEKCVVSYEREGKVRRSAVKLDPEAVAAFVGADESELVIGMESGDKIWCRLWENAGATVFVFNASKVKQFAASLTSSGASDDGRSADALLAMVQSDAHLRHANRRLPEGMETLSRLLRLSDQTARAVVSATNRLRSHLRQCHPSLSLAIGRSLQSAWFLRAVELAPTAVAWRELSDEEQTLAMRGSHRSKREALIKAFGNNWDVVRATEEWAVRRQLSPCECAPHVAAA